MSRNWYMKIAPEKLLVKSRKRKCILLYTFVWWKKFVRKLKICSLIVQTAENLWKTRFLWNLVFFTRQVFGKTNPSGNVWDGGPTTFLLAEHIKNAGKLDILVHSSPFLSQQLNKALVASMFLEGPRYAHVAKPSLSLSLSWLLAST